MPGKSQRCVRCAQHDKLELVPEIKLYPIPIDRVGPKAHRVDLWTRRDWCHIKGLLATPC